MIKAWFIQPITLPRWVLLSFVLTMMILALINLAKVSQ
jgi:hypothetical protein